MPRRQASSAGSGCIGATGGLLVGLAIGAIAILYIAKLLGEILGGAAMLGGLRGGRPRALVGRRVLGRR